MLAKDSDAVLFRVKCQWLLGSLFLRAESRCAAEVNLAGRELSLRSNLPVDDTFWHGPGNSWREDYAGENVRYGSSTAPLSQRVRPKRATMAASILTSQPMSW